MNILKLLEGVWLWGGFATGATLVLMIDATKREAEMERQLWAGVFVAGLMIGLSWFFVKTLGYKPEIGYLILYAIETGAGVFGGIAILRNLPSIMDKIGIAYTLKTAAERNKKTDVREIKKHLPVAQKEFDPTDYFSDHEVFFGLDEFKKNVGLDRAIHRTMPHIQVVGTTGAGKGVVMGVLAAQWITSGEAVFMLDPKDDEWGPHVYARAASSAGAEHNYINLRSYEPQFSIFEGANADEIEELFIAGFSLGDTGKSADFYNISDRKYASIIARQIAEEGITAAEAYEINAEILEKDAPKFGGKLRELGAVAAANANHGAGISFQKIIEKGGSCYIVGHMRVEKIIRLQKMILVRLLQIAEKRDRISGPLRPVGIVLDEVKYHLSRTALEALGAARDKGVHMVLAHQSLADLRDVGGDLSGDAVEGAVVENCKIKICYRVQNPDTAEWLARMSGSILVDDEARTVSKNVALAEKMDSDRTIRQAERYFIDENMLMNLPTYVAVVYGIGLAKFATISSLQAKKSEENIKIKPVEGKKIALPEEYI